MIRILTSDFKNYEKKDGVKITHPMSNENGIVDLLKTVLKETKKVVKEETKDFSKLTVAELKELAKKANIEGYTSMKKAELVEALSK